MSKRNVRAKTAVQQPAKPLRGTLKQAIRAGEVPGVVRRGRFTFRQLKRAVDAALRGQSFEADA